MNFKPKYRPLFKFLALWMALMVLLVQFVEAYHHHVLAAHQQHQPKRRIDKVQIKTECAVCHFYTHQQSPELQVNQIITLVLAAMVFSMLVQVLIRANVGYRYEIAGRGPPTMKTLFV